MNMDVKGGYKKHGFEAKRRRKGGKRRRDTTK
jgi:hypothetical protein